MQLGVSREWFRDEIKDQNNNKFNKKLKNSLSGYDTN